MLNKQLIFSLRINRCNKKYIGRSEERHFALVDYLFCTIPLELYLPLPNKLIVFKDYTEYNENTMQPTWPGHFESHNIVHPSTTPFGPLGFNYQLIVVVIPEVWHILSNKHISNSIGPASCTA